MNLCALRNLCIILIDLSMATLPHLNRLLADRSLNSLPNVLFPTWLLHGWQQMIPLWTHLTQHGLWGWAPSRSSAVASSVCLPLTQKRRVPATKAPEQVLRLQSPVVRSSWWVLQLTCAIRGCWCHAHSPAWGSPADSSCFLPFSVWECPAHSWGRLEVLGGLIPQSTWHPVRGGRSWINTPASFLISWWDNFKIGSTQPLRASPVGISPQLPKRGPTG